MIVRALRTLQVEGVIAGNPAQYAWYVPSPGLPLDLTQRQLEVLDCLARGLRNREIEAELKLGSATVSWHVGTVVTKLGAADRVSAGALVRRATLGEEPRQE